MSSPKKASNQAGNAGLDATVSSAGAPAPAPSPARTFTGPGAAPAPVDAAAVASSETLLAPSQPPAGLVPSASRPATVPGRPVRATTGDGATAYASDRPPLPGTAADDDPLVGKRIDHFEIRARLGQGGMGAVYLAHDVSLQRPVAIKVLRHELAADAALIDRLVVEARAQARLQHPNVVTIYYIGGHAGAPYFAMEYVRGKSLEEHLAEVGPLPWASALEYVIQTARALSAAYRRGIIHRDVKPSNLMLAEDRAVGSDVLVADFGLATPIGGRDGSFAGSPHYASPEQIAGAALDHRTDIYALGVTFYQLLTAQRPFEATTVTELFHKHQEEPRPPVPEDKAPWRLRRLVGEMMDRHAAARPASYDELIERLEACRPKETIAGGLIARGMALAVDLVVLAIVGQALAAVFPLSQVAAHQIGLVLFGGYYVAAHARWKRTIGKHLFGLELASVRGRLGWSRLTLRFLVEFWGPIVAVLMIGLQLGAATDLDAVKDQIEHRVGMNLAIVDQSLEAVLKTVLVPNLVLAVPWLGGFFFALFDEQRRALHDRAAATRVVYRHKR